METKMVEIRDECTRIMALAIKTKGGTQEEHAFWRSMGFGDSTVVLVRPEAQIVSYDAYGWNTSGRTMEEAHIYIQRHFDDLPANGAVVDVRFICGETDEPEYSEVWNG